VSWTAYLKRTVPPVVASTLALTRRARALAPYAGWNGFATALNAATVRRNP
jgi:tryptophan-rich sensory protein